MTEKKHFELLGYIQRKRPTSIGRLPVFCMDIIQRKKIKTPKTTDTIPPINAT
jgi:hypothetical protein